MLRRNPVAISRRELRAIVNRHGGVDAFAAMLPVDVRTVRYWLSGERKMRPVIAARIRALPPACRMG
jgi:hypothetical protein